MNWIGLLSDQPRVNRVELIVLKTLEKMFDREER